MINLVISKELRAIAKRIHDEGLPAEMSAAVILDYCLKLMNTADSSLANYVRAMGGRGELMEQIDAIEALGHCLEPGKDRHKEVTLAGNKIICSECGYTIEEGSAIAR